MNALSVALLGLVLALLIFAVWRITRNLRSGRCCEGGNCRQCPNCRHTNCQFREGKEKP